MTFNDFVFKHNLKNKATSNIKIYEVLKNIGLDTKVEIYLRDGSFSTDIGIEIYILHKEHIGFVI